jgi:putative ATP-dependent endonuclease of OLD family
MPASLIACWRLAASTTRKRSQLSFLAGKDAGRDPEPEKLQQFRHVYLAPLRDAQRELDSANSGRLAFIIRQLTDPQARDSFLTDANDALGELGDLPLPKTP